MRNDRGGVIVGYFTKIAVVLSVFALVCFDAVSVGVAKVGVEDVAQSAALAGSDAWHRSKSPARAYRATVTAAEDAGATVEKDSFQVAKDGTVTVRVRKEATTLLLYRTSKTQGWAKVAATGTARAMPN